MWTRLHIHHYVKSVVRNSHCGAAQQVKDLAFCTCGLAFWTLPWELHMLRARAWEKKKDSCSIRAQVSSLITQFIACVGISGPSSQCPKETGNWYKCLLSGSCYHCNIMLHLWPRNLLSSTGLEETKPGYLVDLQVQ